MPSGQSAQDQGSDKSSSRNTNTQADTTSQMSFNQMVKNAGFRNFDHFMQSYGLKMHDHDDIQEGKAILNALYRRDARK
ncbi:hypothetical protein LTR84_007208 [Exophiala bonariae]|uniref:Uncharacterized protein n=1 Tax=Exophiala bonariae TaxID=1690606 RepID=A0AAV9N204_9EURO|nr:hypothetical protein LTR84_007208 [Exophiala bonariae]